jgi:hypothetical protein
VAPTLSTRGFPNTCSSGLVLKAVGLNTKYYLGDTTATERNSLVSVNIADLTTAGDTNIVELWSSFNSVHMRTSNNNLYAYSSNIFNTKGLEIMKVHIQGVIWE